MIFFFPQDIVFEEIVMSTSTLEAQQTPERAFPEDRKDNFAPHKKKFFRKDLN